MIEFRCKPSFKQLLLASATVWKKLVWAACLFVIVQCTIIQQSIAQSASQFTVADASPGPVINDVDCGTASFITKIINVPTRIIITDVNFGVHLNHTYRSDLRMVLKSPAGTSIALMTNTAGSGNNINDLFDDSAATSITAHDGTVTDPLITPTATFPHYPLSGAFPYYSHSHRPTAALSAFNGQNAFGNWTFTVCDSLAQDNGNFRRADLFLSGPAISTIKTSSVLSDGVSGNNPKSLPGAVVRYCILVTNAGSAAASNVSASDPLPPEVTFVSGSLRSGSTCAGATTVEDDDNLGIDESDPHGASILGNTVRGSAQNLTANMAFAIVFLATVN